MMMTINLTDQLSLIALHLGGILPELCIVLGLLSVLIADLLFSKTNKRIRFCFSSLIAFSACVIACFFTFKILIRTPIGTMDDLFASTMLFDRKTLTAQLLMLFGTIVVQVLVWVANHDKNSDVSEKSYIGYAEFQIMILGALLGGMILVRANHWILVYLSLECISLCLYVLTAFNRNNPFSAEASVKFYLYGTFASAVMLFGVSLQYGMTGSLLLFPSEMPEGQPLTAVLFTYLLILTGIGYKVGLVPFHFWLPDAMQGASMPVTTFIATVPKVAGFVWLSRWAETSEANQNPMFYILAVLALISMAWGNLAAFNQTSFKRMMAYSGIAHTGYMTVIILTGDENYSSLIFYLITYTIINLLVFTAAFLFERMIKSDNITDWRGKGVVSSFNTIAMTIGLLALAGLPPTAGFVAKLQIFFALLGAPPKNSWFVWIAIAVVINTVVSLFYYIKVPTELILKKPVATKPLNLYHTPYILYFLITILGFLTLFILLLPIDTWKIYLKP